MDKEVIAPFNNVLFVMFSQVRASIHCINFFEENKYWRETTEEAI